MAKYVVAEKFSISLENYEHGTPRAEIWTLVEYTFYDLFEIVQMYTGYSDKYNWNIFLPFYGNVDILEYCKKDSLDEIKLSDYSGGFSDTKWIYGPITLFIHGGVCFEKYTKTYPSVASMLGKFPIEEEFLRNEKIDNIDKLYKNGRHEIDKRLKEHFIKKYKISNELAGKSYGEFTDSNKIIRM